MQFIHSMKGLGDSIYIRAFVKKMRTRVAIDTPWPQLYEDLPHVTCVKPNTSLRTQAKNVAGYRGWKNKHHVPRGVPGIRPSYREEGIIAGMTKAFGFEPGPMDLPANMLQPLDGFARGSYVVVRPATVRAEWRADTRNPDPHYLHEASRLAMAAGCSVVSVADIQEGHEWAVDPLPAADVRYHKGEFNVVQLLRLVANARFAIGGIGWIVPTCMAAGVPAWVICGGQGGYNSPHHLLVPGNDTLVRFIIPDNFCKCKEKIHDCDKRISDHAGKFQKFLEVV